MSSSKDAAAVNLDLRSGGTVTVEASVTAFQLTVRKGAVVDNALHCLGFPSQGSYAQAASPSLPGQPVQRRAARPAEGGYLLPTWGRSSLTVEAAMVDMGRTGASAAWRSVDGDAAGAARYLDRLTVEMVDIKAAVTALLRLSPGQSALEAGCGLGRDTEAMARQVAPGGHAVGLDLSRELIAQAAERTAPLGLPLRFEVGDVTALPFADESFDAARIERTLQHLPDPAQALAELARVLRRGGRLAALEPDWHTTVVAGGPLEVLRAYVHQKRTGPPRTAGSGGTCPGSCTRPD
jgi:ubiquinone/menaquinone biosynthesis C-methylase UbiE